MVDISIDSQLEKFVRPARCFEETVSQRYLNMTFFLFKETHLHSPSPIDLYSIKSFNYIGVSVKWLQLHCVPSSGSSSSRSDTDVHDGHMGMLRHCCSLSVLQIATFITVYYWRIARKHPPPFHANDACVYLYSTGSWCCEYHKRSSRDPWAGE